MLQDKKNTKNDDNYYNFKFSISKRQIADNKWKYKSYYSIMLINIYFIYYTILNKHLPFL